MDDLIKNYSNVPGAAKTRLASRMQLFELCQK